MTNDYYFHDVDQDPTMGGIVALEIRAAARDDLVEPLENLPDRFPVRGCIGDRGRQRRTVKPNVILEPGPGAPRGE